jgi:hypothetical protein
LVTNTIGNTTFCNCMASKSRADARLEEASSKLLNGEDS